MSHSREASVERLLLEDCNYVTFELLVLELSILIFCLIEFDIANNRLWAQ